MKYIVFLLLLSSLCRADDGYRLWLKYDLIKDAGQRAAFGAMPQTPLGMEFQLTQEYLGFATHLGFDRTVKGSHALAQYRPEVQRQWSNPETCPLPYLLWFHHISWTKKPSGGAMPGC